MVIDEALTSFARGRPGLKTQLQSWLRRLGYDTSETAA